jgi:hypothetical protein
MEMITDNFTFAEILKMRKEKATLYSSLLQPQGGNKPCDAVRVRRSGLWRSRPGKIEPGMEQGYIKKTALFFLSLELASFALLQQIAQPSE